MFDEHDDAIRTLLRRVSVVDVDDSGTQQRLTLEGLASEEFSRVVRSQHFGLSSVPPKGAEGLILAQGGRSDRAHVLGLEHKDHRPRNQEVGDVVLYDAHDNAISLVKKNLRIVGSDTVTIKGAKIVLEGNVYLGGADADKPAAMQGTLDTAGNADVSNLASKVFMK
jgi:phage baseplate assembly protein V